jgi:type IV secretion system protein VirB11
MLRTAFGPAIAAWLDEAGIVEIMLNPDGRLWLDRQGVRLVPTEHLLSAADGERIVRLVAHHAGVDVHAAAPRVSAELPEGGERFEGLLPPLVVGPAFAIRKPATAIFSLDDYVRSGIMPERAARFARRDLAPRQYPRRGRNRDGKDHPGQRPFGRAVRLGRPDRAQRGYA